jgi:hypothetical protein
VTRDFAPLTGGAFLCAVRIGGMIAKEKVPELLYDLCVVLGYCLPPPAHTQIENDPPQTVDAFTDAVFIGEGMDKNRYPKKWLQVRERVQSFFDLHKS